MVELCQAAWGLGRLAWYVGPTYKQAKRIAWKPLKELTRPYWAEKPNETELRIELNTGGTICLKGADNYDSLRGDGLDFLVLDEYASISPEAWTEVLRPALADRQGRALFIGTPQGFNHFHNLVERAETLPDWKVFQFTTAQGGNVAPQELESAAKELDERTFPQEFLATFENLGVGRVYYAFERAQNVRKLALDGRAPLSWALVSCPSHNIMGSDTSYDYETESDCAIGDGRSAERIKQVGSIAHTASGRCFSSATDFGVGRRTELQPDHDVAANDGADDIAVEAEVSRRWLGWTGPATQRQSTAGGQRSRTSQDRPQNTTETG